MYRRLAPLLLFVIYLLEHVRHGQCQCFSDYPEKNQNLFGSTQQLFFKIFSVLEILKKYSTENVFGNPEK